MGEARAALHRERLPRTAAGWTSTPYYLVTLGNAISWGSAREYLERFGIGVNDWRVLAHIANAPGCTATEISQFLRLHKAVISRSVRSLIDKGFVGIDGQDGTRRLYLTESGVSRHNQVLPIALRRQEILLDGLDTEDRERLLSMLRRMHANLSAMNDFDHPHTGDGD